MRPTPRSRWLSPVLLAALATGCTASAGGVAADIDSPRDLALVAPETVGVSASRLERLEAGMRSFVEEQRLAGVHTVMARHGKIVHSSLTGVKDIESGAPLTEDAIFRIYSMSKPITGVAMMMLYEEGKWRLNDPVTKFIPEFEGLQVHAGDGPDGEPILEDANRSMTMRELMTHSSGLAYGLGNGNAVDRMYRETRVLDSSKSLQSMIDTLATLPLLYQPGERWFYSISVDVQGYLVEKLSGQPFDQFLQERIFDPLGMIDTAFYVPEEKLDRLALIHGEDENGALAPPQQGGSPTTPPAGPSGGGGLYGTAMDYLRFSQMVLNEGELDGVRLLSPRSIQMMRTNHLQEQALSTMGPGSGFGLDFGVVMDPAAAGEPYSKGSFRWGGAAGTWFWIDPVEDFVFVGMIQHRGRAVGDVQGQSRNLAYAAILD